MRTCPPAFPMRLKSDAMTPTPDESILPQCTEVDDNFPYARFLDGDHLGLEVVEIRDVEAAAQDDDGDVAPPGTFKIGHSGAS